MLAPFFDTPRSTDPSFRSAAQLAVRYLWGPLLAFVALNLLLRVLGGDQWIADRLYALEGHSWRLKDAFLTQGLVHVRGRQLSALAWLAVAVAWAASFRDGSLLLPWRGALARLALSVLAATAAVAVLKSMSHVDCPWSLLRYGGDREYAGLFGPRAAGAAHCFPAGHASGGYAWMALYFFFRAVRPRLRWWGLGCGIGLGLLFGAAQQLRGAHFLSHDVWSAMICWSVAVAAYLLPARRGALAGWAPDRLASAP